MQKKRIVLLGLLLVISIAGQVLLRPCLGESTTTTATSSQPPAQTTTSTGTESATPWWSSQSDKPADHLEKNLTGKLFMMLALIALIGVGTWYLLKRMNTPWLGNKSGHLQLIETLHLGPRKAVHIIQAGQKRLLIGNSNDGIRFLTDLTEALNITADQEES